MTLSAPAAFSVKTPVIFDHGAPGALALENLRTRRQLTLSVAVTLSVRVRWRWRTCEPGGEPEGSVQSPPASRRRGAIRQPDLAERGRPSRRPRGRWEYLISGYEFDIG
jgi:hypothetical protein